MSDEYEFDEDDFVSTDFGPEEYAEHIEQGGLTDMQVDELIELGWYDRNTEDTIELPDPLKTYQRPFGGGIVASNEEYSGWIIIENAEDVIDRRGYR